MKKNPFEVLGITPEMAGRLNEEQLFSLVRSNYRILLKALHPDVCRSATEHDMRAAHLLAVELNQAFERVNLSRNPMDFRRFKQQYTSRTKRGLRRELDRTRQEVGELGSVKEKLSSQFLYYVFHFLDQQGTGIASPQKFSPHVFSLRNLRIGLHDVAVAHNLRHSAWNLGKNYKEIRFDEWGCMHYKALSRNRYSEVRFIRLLGSVEACGLDVVAHMNRKVSRNRRPNHPYVASFLDDRADGCEVSNTIDIDVFRDHCLPLLTPALRENAYLFSVHLDHRGSVLEGDPREIWVEGKIVKLDREPIQESRTSGSAL